MKLHMKLPIGLVCAMLFLTLSVQPCYGSMPGTPPSPPTLEERSKHFRHVFIGEVVSKEVAETETHYTFNVSEWLMDPLNTSQIQWIEDGGSVIMSFPSTTLYVGIDYLVFFDDINGTRVGKDRHFLLFNKISDDEMIAFRDYLSALKSVFLPPVIASEIAPVDFPPAKKIPVDLRPHTLLVSWVILLLILSKLLKK